MPSLPSRLPSEIPSDPPLLRAGSQARAITLHYASPTLNSLASASSSRSQVHARTASAAVRLTWERPSVGVRPAGSAEAPALKGGSRRSFLRSGEKGSWGALDAGGADPDNARRSVPVPVAFARRSAHSVRARRPGPARVARHRGVTAGTGCGRCRGSRPATASPPATLPLITGHPAALLSPGCSRQLA
jgi:hypothetical protein